MDLRRVRYQPSCLIVFVTIVEAGANDPRLASDGLFGNRLYNRRDPVRRLTIVTTLVLLTTAALPADQGGVPATLSVHPINRKDFTNPGQFSFLAPLLKDVEVVSLAESIHMTHEFPLVRLGIVRYLNEYMDFHVLVMEGSAPDVWVAQDVLLDSAHTHQDCKRALGGFFGLWNTSEMQKVIT